MVKVVTQVILEIVLLATAVILATAGIRAKAVLVVTLDLAVTHLIRVIQAILARVVIQLTADTQALVEIARLVIVVTQEILLRGTVDIRD